MMAIILHCDLDAFFAHCELQRDPGIEPPLAVCIYSGRGEDGGAVSTADYAAREIGIESAMPITA
ncbi:MAG: DNA polymerase IV, partial [Candidatus Nanohaloarchaea archaeon]